ncbi:MAG: hypothetical protein U0984_18875 [Prosthecobacter sp.]|nr:hypothetical protein [Prosthecobacter sp.]
MTATPSPPGSSPAVTGLLVLAGIVFTVLWIVAHVTWATMSLMGTLMANDSGAASNDQHMALMGGMLGGQIVAGAAGIPGGLAFFWRGKRKLLLILFAILFVAGALWQVAAFYSFFSSASAHP